MRGKVGYMRGLSRRGKESREEGCDGSVGEMRGGESREREGRIVLLPGFSRKRETTLCFLPVYVLTSVEDIRRGSVYKCKGGGGS